MRIFISYAHVDKPIVEQWLVVALRDAGHDVWVDEQLVGGRDWQAQLSDAIERCDALVYAISPEALSSEVCRWEVEEARRQEKFILPVLMQARVKLPNWLGKIQYIDFSQGATAQAVAKLLGSLKPSPSSPASSPDSMPLKRDNPMIKLLSHPAFQGLIGVVGLIIAVIALNNGTPVAPTPTINPLATPDVRLTVAAILDAPGTEQRLLALDITATEAMLQRTVAARERANATLMAENTRLAATLDAPTETVTFTPSPTLSHTPSVTPTPSETLTFTPSPTPTATLTDIPSLTPTITPTRVVTNTPVQAYPCNGTIVTTGEAISISVIRSQPSGSSTLLASIRVGTQVQITERSGTLISNSWYRIVTTSGSLLGWIPVNYVSPSTNCPS